MLMEAPVPSVSAFRLIMMEAPVPFVSAFRLITARPIRMTSFYCFNLHWQMRSLMSRLSPLALECVALAGAKYSVSISSTSQ